MHRESVRGHYPIAGRRKRQMRKTMEQVQGCSLGAWVAKRGAPHQSLHPGTTHSSSQKPS